MTTQNKWIVTAGVIVAVLATCSTAYYLKQRGKDPAKMTSDQIHAYMQSPDFNSMPRQQRRAFFEKVMDSRVQGYFNTPPSDRDKYLDKIIDDMQRFRPTDVNSQRQPPDPNRAQRRNNVTSEQRRLRRETQDPVKNAQRREFFGALRAQAQSRGVQLGGGGGGRRLF